MTKFTAKQWGKVILITPVIVVVAVVGALAQWLGDRWERACDRITYWAHK